jgi:succinyl-diaminopimelate desuccinylase
MTRQKIPHADLARLLKVLKDLVAFKTVAPPGSFYHEIVDYLVPIFREMGFRTEKLVMPQEVFESRCEDKRLRGDRANLIASLDVGAKETMVIYTHLDVVPPGEGWSTDPFLLTEKEGKVYGRGVSDSKGAVAALIAVLEALRRQQVDLKYNLRVMLTTDEEVGGYSGLCYLTDLEKVKGERMLCMDGFSDDLVIGSNGMITWEVVVRGVSSHSASGFLGVNAVERALPIMSALMELKGAVQSRRSALAANSSLESMGITSLMPVLNLTMINGGIKENIIPDKCILRGDRRVIPEETMDEAMAEMERAIRHLDVDLELRFFPGYPPMSVNPDHSFVSLVREAVEKGMGFPPRLSGTQGSLDQAYATEKTKIPTCVYGVGRQLESNIHARDENVRIADLEGFARFLVELLRAA